MTRVEDLIQTQYVKRLAKHHIPLDPTQRTPDQINTAALLFWAVQNEIALDAGTLTQAAVEVN